MAGALTAQAGMIWDLVIESVSAAGIDMRLDVYNYSSAAWYHEFPSSTIALYSIDGQYFFDADIPVITPYTLPAGYSDSFAMQHPYPLAEGAHSVQAHINIPEGDGYQAVGMPELVRYPPDLMITVGEGLQRARIPIDFYWRSTLYESIYTATELQHQPGTINAVGYFYEFSGASSTPFLEQTIRIWMGHTFQTGLEDGWIAAGELTPVFDGQVNFPLGNNEVIITLSTPFDYVGNQNLVLLITRPLHGSYQFSADPFVVDTCGQWRALKHYTDMGSIDPYDPPLPQPASYVAQIPKTRFYITPNGDPVEVSDPQQAPPALRASVYPNPFREGCVVTPNRNVQGSMDVFNLRGQIVRRLMPSRDGTYHWDGNTESGAKCGPGIYLFGIDSGRERCVGKMLLTK
jgi:hypothetical protein